MSRRPTSSLPTKDGYTHEAYAKVLQEAVGAEWVDPKAFKKIFNATTWRSHLLKDEAVKTTRAVALACALSDLMDYRRHPFASFETRYRSDSVTGPNHLSAWPAQPDLAAKARLSVDTLPRAINDLVDAGWLQVRKVGRYYRYLLTFPDIPSVWDYTDPMWSAAPTTSVRPELPHHAEDDEEMEDELPHHAEDQQGDELPHHAETNSAPCGVSATELPHHAEDDSAPCGTIHTSDPSPAAKKIHRSEVPSEPASHEGTPAEEQKQDLSQEHEPPKHKITRRPVICYLCTGEIDLTGEFDDEDLDPRHTACAERLTARGAA